MKLLICTQAVDRKDPVLGFFIGWIEEFAKHCEQVSVICLREGEHALPENVRVYSLGKESGAVSKWRYALRFWKLIWQLRNDYDSVFVHMNPEYVVLGGKFWRLWRKKIGLWYVHKSVDTKLRIATWFVHLIFTASPESFRLQSPKLKIMGHGIDPAFFQTHLPHRNELRLITTGRISPTKNIRAMLDVAAELYSRGKPSTLVIAGAPVTVEDEKYLETLQSSLADKPYSSSITWAGPIPHEQLPRLLAESDLFLNFSATGSLDKAVLEALASGLTVISNNEAFRHLLEPHGLFAPSTDPQFLADLIITAANASVEPLSSMVAERHSLERLIPAILAALQV